MDASCWYIVENSKVIASHTGAGKPGLKCLARRRTGGEREET